MADDPTKKDPDQAGQGADEGGEGKQEPEGNEAKGAKDPEGEGKQDPADPDEGVKDKHGQPGINKERHDKEVAALNAKIEELQKQVNEAAETKAGREKLQQELDAVKAQMADSDVTHSLEMAGCVNVKAAKAVLSDYEGDVAKLKGECPYLFQQAKQTGSVGGKPSGAPSGEDELVARARKAAGTTRYYQQK